MDYFKNRLFTVGFTLIILAAGLTSLFGESQNVEVLAAIMSVIGLLGMFYGIYRQKKQTKS